MSVFYIICQAIVVVGSMLIIGFPLAVMPGYEFALLVTVLVSPLAGLLTIWQYKLSSSVAQDLWRALIWSLSLLIFPLLLGFVNTLRLGGCDWMQGVGFFVLLPFSCVIVSTIVAQAIQFKFIWPKRATSIFIVVLFLSLLFTLVRVVFGVPVFAFNPFFGYFPGPIYDFDLTIHSTLIFHRLFSFCLALAVFFIAQLTIKWRSKLLWLGATSCVLLCISACFFESKLGFYTSREHLQNTLGGKISASTFDIYYDKRLEQDQFFLPEAFRDDVSFWLTDISQQLQIKIKNKITLYVYNDAKSKKRLMGAGYTLIGDPVNRELHLLPVRFPSTILKHELTHVVAAQFGMPWLGFGRSPGIMEGLAVALEESRLNLDLHKWSAKILSDKKLFVDATLLMQGFQFFGISERYAYLLAGSFVRFLLEEFTTDKFLQVYRSGDFEEVYGVSLSRLNLQWLDRLQGTEFDSHEAARMTAYLAPKGVLEARCVHDSTNWRQRGVASFKNNENVVKMKALGCFLKSYRLSNGSSKDLYWLTQVSRRDFSPMYHFGFAWLLSKSDVYADLGRNELIYLYLSFGERFLAYKMIAQQQKQQFSSVDQLALELLELGYLEELKVFYQNDNNAKMHFLEKLVAEDIDMFLLHVVLTSYYLNQAGAVSPKLKASVDYLQSATSASQIEPLKVEAKKLLRQYYWQQQQYDKALFAIADIRDDHSAKIWRRRLLSLILSDG